MVTRSTRILRTGAAALGVTALTLGATGASAASHTAAAPRASVVLNGAGSTFIAPLLQGAVIPQYTKANPNVQINYNPIGSGAGIALFTKGSVNFAGSDALLSAAQANAATSQCGGGQSGGVIKIPATIGAVALFFNLPGVQTGLKLSSDVVANIFLGKVTNWSDPSIKSLNPSVNLPNLAIQTVHRADGSGTTYIFTHYLSAISPQWSSSVGSGATVNWPNGSGAKGSSGVAAAVQQTQGAIGYADLAYAIQNSLPYAYLQNAKGNFIAPSSTSASLAANSFAKAMPSDLQQIIVNSSDPKAYPLTGYSYIFMCGRQTGSIGHTLLSFVKYEVTTGQKFAGQLYYGSIPSSVQKLELTALGNVRQ